ncbi:hypothetical protein L0O74_14615, partial [Bifidobacterium longum]|nr:hypothetical protein [Bifidobacterium longum]
MIAFKALAWFSTGMKMRLSPIRLCLDKKILPSIAQVLNGKAKQVGRALILPIRFVMYHNVT